MSPVSAPTLELGKLVDDIGWLVQWNDLASQTLEQNTKLQWPESVSTYYGMMADSQIQGCVHGTTWPLFRMRWYIHENGAPDSAIERISKDYNLPVGRLGPGETDDDTDFIRRRTQNRFNFLEHLEQALDALFYGLKIFEQVGEIGDDGQWHLRKLADRPLLTINEFKTAKDGGVEYIRQHGYDEPEIPVSRLILYPFQKRGANWMGRSMLRGCYGPWLLKDRAMRVGVMNLQRAGVGTPVIEGHPGATDAELQILNRIAERFKAGERSGGAIPFGAKLRLVGVEGSQPDAAGFIKLMNEEISRAFLQMFMQLGQSQSGSRALGKSFVDWHKMTIEYLAYWFSNIFSEHMMEDDLEWNEGPDEEYAPLLRWQWDESTREGVEAMQDPSRELKNQIDNGNVQAPDDVKRALDKTDRGVVARSARRRTTRAAGSTAPADALSAVGQLPAAAPKEAE